MTLSSSRPERCASAAFFLMLIFGFALAHAQKKDAGVFQPDKGKFSVQLDGKTIGHEEFEIAPSAGGWLAHGTTTIKSDSGAETKVTGNLTMQPDGSPAASHCKSQP